MEEARFALGRLDLLTAEEWHSRLDSPLLGAGRPR
jgi:hypothetical protein